MPKPLALFLAGAALLLNAGCAFMSSAGKDLERYRGHAVEQGSRDPEENLERFVVHLKGMLAGIHDVVKAGYAGDNVEARENDFKHPSVHASEAGKSLKRTGKYFLSIFYSLIDLLAFNALPDPDPEYEKVDPWLRPPMYLGKTVRGSIDSGVGIMNIPMRGLADNIKDAAYDTVEEAAEALKSIGQAAANAAIRKPVRFLVKNPDSDKADKVVDWFALVPFEYLSNLMEGEGFTNLEDYRESVQQKGYTFITLELGGNTFLLIRSLSRLVPEDEEQQE